MSLNLGKIQVGQAGSLNQISYGNQSPTADTTPLSWNTGDVRYSIDGTTPGRIKWVCTAGGTPGTWVEVSTASGPAGATGATGVAGPAGAPGVTGATGPTGTAPAAFDLFLSYGNQSGDGALPTPPEATPSFYLRPNTDKTVQMSFSGSPGAVWEYDVGNDLSGLVTLYLDVFVYSCGLTPAGAGPATLTFHATINGASATATFDVNGLTNTRVIATGTAFISIGFTIGIQVVTTNMGSGFLMATAYLRLRP